MGYSLRLPMKLGNQIAALSKPARMFYGLAMIVFGVQHLVYGQYVTRVFPKLPLPAQLAGIVLMIAGGLILLGRWVRTAALALAFLILTTFLLFYVPQLLKAPFLGGVWTNAGKALALAGGALLVAGLFRTVGRALLSAFLILGGIQHFLYPGFVAALVPHWMPWHLFWTYLAAVALIAGGIGLHVRSTRELAGLLTGTMIFLWVFLLHIPRALAAPRNTNETTAVFEALAFSGIAWLAARR